MIRFIQIKVSNAFVVQIMDILNALLIFKKKTDGLYFYFLQFELAYF